MNYKVMGACVAVFLSIKAQGSDGISGDLVEEDASGAFETPRAEARPNPLSLGASPSPANSFCDTPPDASEIEKILLSNIEPNAHLGLSDTAVRPEEDFISFGELSQEHKEILLRSLWTGGMNEAKKRIVAMELGSLSKSDLETVLTECAALPLKDFESVSQIIGKYIGDK